MLFITTRWRRPKFIYLPNVIGAIFYNIAVNRTGPSKSFLEGEKAMLKVVYDVIRFFRYTVLLVQSATYYATY